MTVRPTYKPEDPALLSKLPEGIAPPQGNGAADTPTQLPPPPLFKHPIQDDVRASPARASDPTSTVINAGNALYRVMMAQIAYHEAELKKLRDLLRQFAMAAGKPDENVRGSAPISQEDMHFLQSVLQNAQVEK